MEKITYDISVVLPGEDADHDPRQELLISRLESVSGVEKAHVVDNRLCLHVDANLLPLSRLERLAHELGGEVASRYRHEFWKYTDRMAADAAPGLTRKLQEQPGVVHALVNPASAQVCVAYDTQILDHAGVCSLLEQYGLHLEQPHEHHEHGHDHEHGHGCCGHGPAPSFLPPWLKDYWSWWLIGVSGVSLGLAWAGQTFWSWPAVPVYGLYLLAYLSAGYDLATHALPGLLKGRLDSDLLMLLAAVGAALLGQWGEGGFLLFLFAIGHAGEHYALDRARKAVSALGQLMPSRARLRVGQEVREVDVAQLNPGDVVVVPAGERIPADGQVVAGQSSVDQSPITGESVPVLKSVGNEVFAGTINQNGGLDVRVEKRAEDNMLARVMQLVAEAQEQQSPTQQLTQRFTRRFVPFVLVLTLAMIVLPPLLGWLSWPQSFYRAMLLLVGASPCALALGTPAAMLAAIAQAARHGVLLKGGAHLENLAELRVVAFDKTGTLTEGKFEVAEVWAESSTEELLQLAAALEQQSSHPLAAALVRKAGQLGLEIPGADNVQNHPGKGLEGMVAGRRVRAGSRAMFELEAEWVRRVEAFEASGQSLVLVEVDGRMLGVIGLRDQLRGEIRPALAELQQLGVGSLVMLTGDHARVAQQVSAELGLSEFRANLLPAEKLAAIRELEARHGKLAMVGDGVNDAPALAAATVGVAMGGIGTAVALEIADMAVMGDDLRKLPWAVRLGRATRAVVMQNLAVAVTVITVLMFGAVTGQAVLSAAVVLHEGSTLLVVFNALRLLAFR